MEGVLSKGVLSGNGLCLEGVMYGGGFVRAPQNWCVHLYCLNIFSLQCLVYKHELYRHEN